MHFEEKTPFYSEVTDKQKTVPWKKKNLLIRNLTQLERARGHSKEEINGIFSGASAWTESNLTGVGHQWKVLLSESDTFNKSFY
jgi:hypothetical protein